MKPVINEQYIRGLFSKPKKHSEKKDFSTNKWATITEGLATLFIGVLSVFLCIVFSKEMIAPVVVSLGGVIAVLITAIVICMIKWILFNKKLRLLAEDEASSFKYHTVDAVFVERTNHGYDSAGSGLTYEFNIDGRTCIFSDVIFFGDKRPANECYLVKIAFSYSNRQSSSRIYCFNKLEYDFDLPAERCEELFTFKNMTCPKCSVVE